MLVLLGRPHTYMPKVYRCMWKMASVVETFLCTAIAIYISVLFAWLFVKCYSGKHYSCCHKIATGFLRICVVSVGNINYMHSYHFICAIRKCYSFS